MSQQTILVVEDNPTTCKLYRVTLEAEGYQVLEAPDAHTALRLMKSHAPDLVLQDLVVPDMEGHELTRRLREIPGRLEVPIITVSGFHHMLPNLGSAGIAADASLLKPVDPSRLVEVVHTFLAPPTARPDKVGRGRRILVVDDDPVQLKLSRLRLRLAGFDVITSSDSAAALALARQEPPDLILSDVLMPNLDGFDLCLAVREDARLSPVPVVLVSAHYCEPNDQELAKKVGAGAFVARLPDFHAIIDAIVAVLEETQVPGPVSEPLDALREEHSIRITQQLKRQATVNTTLLQRCALQAAQLSVLGGVADALARTADMDATLRDILAACLDAGGVSKGALCRIDNHGKVVLTHALGFSEALRSELESRLNSKEVLEAILAGQSVQNGLFWRMDVRAGLIVPLKGDGSVTGALFLGSNVESMLQQDLLAFGRAIGAYISQASSLMAAFDRLGTTAEASRVLSASLDLDKMLDALAQLMTTRVADLCEIDLLHRGGKLRRTSVIPAEPAREQLVRELHDRYPGASATDPGEAVLRGGPAQWMPEVTDEWRVATAHDAEHLRLLRALDLQSRMVVPLLLGGDVIGSIGFGRFHPGRRFGQADLTVAEDVARRTAIAVENARLYQLAQEANRTKDEFLATVSHELRTPLSAVLGWTLLLRGKPADHSLLERGLATIERNARSQLHLIEDILDVSRITTGRLALRARHIDIAAAVQSAVEVVFPTASAKEITIDVQCDPATGMVWGDLDRLQQVFWNLLSNAVKFCPQGGRVQVRVTRLAHSVEIEVADTGKGIAPGFLPHVFERFRQADASTSRAYGGLGLGLALVRHLVELHGGSVRVTSEGDGRGATFTVTLPIPTRQKDAQQSNSTQGGGPPLPAGKPVGRGQRVLLIDDDPDGRMLVSLILEAHAFEVVAVGSAPEGMGALERFHPAVIICDIGMPDEDGFSFIARLREVSNVPALALTAYAGAADALKARQAGFELHMSKPVEPAQLIHAVMKLVEL